MATEDVRQYFEEKGYDFEIYELDESTATVEDAAKAHGVPPSMIAKSLAFALKDRNIMIIAKGDARVDNKKYKSTFGQKARMLKPDEVLEITGHPVEGLSLCSEVPMEIYLDRSLQDFEVVYPAAGAPNSSIKITPETEGDHQGYLGGCLSDNGQTP